ncbi:PAS/PAC sensor hybrid histidine kinase [Nitrosococcus oceani ATCC 19707]|uniref:histidine kinase n=2 Tax=Nitrosococcus oceani TaxID=1229 RepID=Q3JAH4_NITOC|nr:ATP-binding protein [Nitrosococcus oceani]ABA58172.1 PAS/PAC sensor hybrid histidine kinase [Nitrosococcus oceani ATCC 19707]EDZ67111.1 PAS fold family [Nitrosococcus oceani AFC27]KFI19386.1 ATPase [Nitrosococcus oceani C-27]GEM20392.1 hybrid sensor histidine kinase/response regulator [Nitrosococcus oceani]
MLANSNIVPKINLLLIEDNPGDVRLVQLALQEVTGVKFETTAVERLSQALSLLEHQQFDAILLDLTLPDCHGLHTFSQVKEAAPQLPIVVLSGLSNEELAIEAVKLGAQDYLVKGQSNNQLAGRALRYAVERKQTETVLRQARDELEQRIAERTAHLKKANCQLQQEILQRKRTEALLRKERDFSSMILDTADVLVVILNSQGQIVRLNRAFQKISGYPSEEAQGRYLWELTYFPDQIKKDTREKLKQWQTPNTPKKHESYWQAKTGERYLIAWSSTALFAPSGALDYVIYTGIDITEQRQAEDLARQRLLELAHISRLSTLGEMAAQIAHELNQPLGAITTYSDICLRTLEPQTSKHQPLRDILEEIATQAERGGKIIRHLRNLIHKKEQRWASLAINELIRETVGIMQAEARWQNITIKLDLQTSLPSITADSLLLQQVFLNLMRNAFDAMIANPCNGDRQIRIKTSWIKKTAIEIQIQDTGPGLPDNLKQKIFEPFFTTKTEGMGMGLPICQSIIEAHGGWLLATDNKHGGAVFQLRLPIISPKNTLHGS